MTKDEMKFVSDLVVPVLGLPQSEVASLLFEIKEDETGEVKPTALQTLLDKSAVRVASFKEAETKAFDKGFSKAKAESISKFEGDLKEKFGITSDKQGLELIEFAVSEKLKAQGGELDEQKIKRSTEYLNMVERLTKEKADAVTAKEKEFNDLKDSIQKESTFKTIAEQVNDMLNEFNPILPEGKTPEGKSKAEIQKQLFIKELLAEYELELKEGKTLVAKGGKILEDKHGNMIAFKDVVKNKASELWDFKEGEQRQGTGNNNDGTDGGNGASKGYKGPAPKDDVEYRKMIGEAKTLEEQKGIMELWVAGQKATS